MRLHKKSRCGIALQPVSFNVPIVRLTIHTLRALPLELFKRPQNMWMDVMPAKAGIQYNLFLDSRLRGNDE